jgi:diguanylate cyclase
MSSNATTSDNPTNKKNTNLNDDELNKSLTHLRKAIALMVQYKIPTTPIHYAVWYAYVAKTNSYIVNTIDTNIKKHGFCTAIVSEELYHTYLASPLEKTSAKVKNGLEAMVQDLMSSMDDVLTNTTNFNDKISNHFNNLSNITQNKKDLTLETTLEMIQSIIDHSEEIKQSSKEFSQSLTEAQKEVQKLKKELSIVKIQTTHDALTGLLNRRALDQDINQLINIKNKFSVIMVDLDHFKKVNDTYGHRIGDIVLKSTSKVLEERTSGLGRVYRYGGEEMIILLPNTLLFKARTIAEQCRMHIERISIKEKNSINKNQPITLASITASFGVAEFNENDTVASLIDRADHQLYQAKNTGRNKVMPPIL